MSVPVDVVLAAFLDLHSTHLKEEIGLVTEG